MSNERLSNSSSSEEYLLLLNKALAESSARQLDDYSKVGYFGRYFPHDAIPILLGENIKYRQFAFAYNVGNSVVWDPYQSFADLAELKQFLKERNPVRIDVGPYGTCPPTRWKQQRIDQKQSAVEPEHDTQCLKELILDIDLKDVKLRTCVCSGTESGLKRCATCGLEFINYQVYNKEGYCRCKWDHFSKKLCEQCWNFAQMYVLILDYLLRDKWGFRNLQFVFSGGKGFHCWILDEHARYFTTDQRKSFVESFQPFLGDGKLKDEEHVDDQLFGKDFESFVLPLFTEKVLRTGIFNARHPATCKLIFDIFPIDEKDETATSLFMGTMDEVMKLETSEEAWNRLMDYTFRVYSAFQAKLIQRKFVYAYVFPPLDERITRDHRHLLKIPFSLHPNTGFLSIPLSAVEFFNFTPDRAPHVEQPTEIARCAENFVAIAGIRGVKLNSFLICKKDELHDTNVESFADLPIGEVQTRFEHLLKHKLHRRQIFATEFEYRRHCRRCSECDSTLMIYRENDLETWLQRLAWIDSNYNDAAELGMRIALSKHLADLRLLELPPGMTRLAALF